MAIALKFDRKKIWLSKRLSKIINHISHILSPPLISNSDDIRICYSI